MIYRVQPCIYRVQPCFYCVDKPLNISLRWVSKQKMKENFIKLSHNLIFILITSAAVIFPLAFLPTTTEFFDFNKFTALLIITVAGLLIWALRMILEKKASFTRTPLDIPLLILLVVIFVSAFASIDQFGSLIGSPQRLWPSFFPFATLIAFYFLASSNLNKRKQVTVILWVISLSTTLAAIIAAASYFGLYLPFDFAHVRSFNTVGIINRLAILEAFVIPITAFWAVFEKNKQARAIATILTLIIAFSLILINSLPSFIGLGATLLFIATASLKTKLEKHQQGAIAILAVFTILFLVIRFVPQVARGTLYSWIVTKDPTLTEQQQISTPLDRSLPLSAAWDIAAQSIGKRPLFGTGPGTYQFVYTQLKPRTMNGTSDWAVRFNKSSSDFTEMIATLGIFGILAYLLLAVAILRFIWALIFKSQHSMLYAAIAAAIIGSLVSNFFALSSFATTGIFFLGLALLSTLAKSQDESHVFDITVELATLKSRFAWFPLGTPSSDLIKTTPAERGGKSQVLPILFLIAVLLSSTWAIKTALEAYRGEYYFRQSLLASRSNDGNRTLNFIQKALAADPKVDTYHRTLAQFSLNAAINLTQRGNLNDSEKQLLGQLAQVAIDQAKVASGYQILPLRLPGITAANVENWEVLSSIYQALIGSVGGADVHATNTLAQAIALDPQNPILHDRLGQLYQRLGNTDLAQRKYEDSTIVKGDYGPGHYRLAKLLIEKKAEVPKIVNELSLAKKFLDPKDPAISDIEKDLETYNRQLQDLQKEAADKQKNQVAPSPSPTPSANPSPSPIAKTSPSPSPTPTQNPSF